MTPELKPEEDKRRLFLVIADDTPDALMRVLGVANVQQTRLRALRRRRSTKHTQRERADPPMRPHHKLMLYRSPALEPAGTLRPRIQRLMNAVAKDLVATVV